MNTRTQPGSGPKLIIGGTKIGPPDRPDKAPRWQQSTPTSGPGSPGGFTGKSLPGGGQAGNFLPRNAPYKPGRKDQGRDGATTPGGPIIAPGNGVVLRVASDPNGFGPNYPIVKFSSGPYNGRLVYLGHTHSVLRAGAKFTKDEVLSVTGKSPVGNATIPGWFEIGFADSGSPGPLGQPAPF